MEISNMYNYKYSTVHALCPFTVPRAVQRTIIQTHTAPCIIIVATLVLDDVLPILKCTEHIFPNRNILAKICAHYTLDSAF